jgi:glucose/arabinose dehydrogenase
MGDDVPPDTLYIFPREGEHFGYRYCQAGDTADPKYGRAGPCRDFSPPAARLGAHVAPLGMRFYTGRQFPDEYRNQIFIAEHGSWNRSHKSGYRVTLVRLDGQGKAVSYTAFAQGWLQGESAWGRPADVIVAPDGSLLVSDDHAGAIYRVRYGR